MLFASLALVLILVGWQPLPQVVWQVVSPIGVLGLQAIFWLGWGVLPSSTFLLDHFELFGLKQTFMRAGPSKPPVLRTSLFYRWVRHPIYVGFLFAIGTTGYILIGIALEERDLVDQFGDAYRRYRERVGMLFPRWGRRTPAEPTPPLP